MSSHPPKERPGRPDRFRVVVDGFLTRDLARNLARQLLAGAEPAGLSILIEPDPRNTGDRVIERVTLP